MRPTITDVHVNAPLTNLSVAYMQSAADFVADRVFPVIPSDKPSNLYYSYPKGDWFRNDMLKRAAAAESEGSSYAVNSNNTFSVDVWALHRDIPDQIRAASDAVLNPDLEATEFLARRALINKEVAFATSFLTTGVWVDWAGVAAGPVGNQVIQWNDYVNATPVQDIRKVKRSIKAATGIMPNVLTLTRDVYDTLLDHPTVLDRIKYNQNPGNPAISTRDILAQLFEVDEVLVMDGLVNAAKEGVADSLGFIATKKALLTYRPLRPGLMTVAAGYTFAWTGYTGAAQNGSVIRRFRMEPLRADRVEIEQAYVQKQIAGDVGAFLTTIIA